MANRYWVLTTGGTWNTTSTGKWSTTSGGSPGASIPTINDDVFFDTNSGSANIIVGTTVNCKSIDFTGFTGTFSGTSQMNIGTSTAGQNNIALKLNSSMNWSYIGTITFKSSVVEPQTINGATKSFGGAVTFNGSGVFRILDDLLLNNKVLTLTAGNLIINDSGSVSCSSFVSATSNTRTLQFGANSQLSLNGTGTIFNPTMTNFDSMIFDVTSRLIISNTSSTAKTFNGHAMIFGDLIVSGDNVTLAGGFYCSRLQLNNAGLPNGTKINVTSSNSNYLGYGTGHLSSPLSCNGFSGNLVKIRSTPVVGQATLSLWNLEDSVDVDFIDIKDIYASTYSGTGVFYAGNNSINSGNNTNWVFTTKP